MSWDIFPKDKIEYFLEKLKGKLDGKADSGEVEGLKTVTGNPITLTDASETYAQGLTVELEPKQDLHGYDFPWVGGEGKNKAEVTLTTGGNYNVDSQGRIKCVATTSSAMATAIGVAHLLGGITYVLSGGVDNDFRLYITIDGSNYTSREGDSDQFTPSTSGDYNFYLVQNTGAVVGDTVLPMIRLATETDPTFAPYSNICPISGYGGVEVDDVGKNLFDKSKATVGKYISSAGVETTNNGMVHSDYIRVKSNTTYYTNADATGMYYIVVLYDENKNFIYALHITSPTNFNTLTASYVIINTFVSNTSIDDLYLVEGSTASPYEPYQSSNVTIQLGQTVYGGSVDLTTGVLTVDRASVDMGTLNWEKRFTSFYVMLSDMIPPVNNKMPPNVLLEKHKYIPKSSDADSGQPGTYEFIVSQFKGITYRYPMEDYATGEDFAQAMSGDNLCYLLAEPFTIQLTPQELKLLQDTNNLTTNGTTIALDYIPNNSIGDAVKASEEYTDRAVERVIPKAKLLGFYEIYDESGTLYDVTIPTATDANFILFEYRIQSRVGSTLIPSKSSYNNYISVEVNNGVNQNWVEFLYNSTYHTLTYASNVTTGFGVLSIYAF